MNTKKIILGAGCFWGVEESFREVKGVLSTRVGYAGGHLVDPSYQQVCSGLTGHVEVVEIIFDSQIIGFMDLLNIFFEVHDPTTIDRQGPDIGSQYRSVIFYTDESQEDQARKAIAHLKAQNLPIVTKLELASTFYPAEEYHQKYILKLKNKSGL